MMLVGRVGQHAVVINLRFLDWAIGQIHFLAGGRVGEVEVLERGRKLI